MVRYDPKKDELHYLTGGKHRNRPSREGEVKEDKDTRNRDWRELDRQRDGSVQRTEPRRGEAEGDSSRFKTRYQEEQYKKQLEGLFSGPKKPSAAVQEQVKKIRAARGVQAITKACQEFVKQFEVPKDWETLILFLDGNDSELLKVVLERLEKGYADQTSVRQQNLKQQLRIFIMTSSDRSLKQQAEALLTRWA